MPIYQEAENFQIKGENSRRKNTCILSLKKSKIALLNFLAFCFIQNSDEHLTDLVNSLLFS